VKIDNLEEYVVDGALYAAGDDDQRKSDHKSSHAQAPLKVGIVKELFDGELTKGFQPAILQQFKKTVALLEQRGVEIQYISCPHFEYAFAAYYLIQPSEVSSNLARYDGVRYGLRVPEKTAETTTRASRTAGFGAEVKRRIMLGTYALSAGYYDAYYGSACKVRTLVKRDFAKAFQQVDVLITPTTPTTAFKLHEKIDDPLQMYLNDIATIPANLAGVPAISLPCGIDELGLPVGFQIIAAAGADTQMYFYAGLCEALIAQNSASQKSAK
jgi:aspartyl-tRNA(Asn)/glutamyl-tRNA(Gln) amidotransferase subunit A